MRITERLGVETRDEGRQKKKPWHPACDATCAAAACLSSASVGPPPAPSKTIYNFLSPPKSSIVSTMARYAVLLVVAALACSQLAQVGQPSLTVLDCPHREHQAVFLVV